MLNRIKRAAIRWYADFKRESRVPPPPFKASKRTGWLMNGVWYGRLAPDEMREQALEWGFDSQRVEELIKEATAAPSFWAQRENEV